MFGKGQMSGLSNIVSVLPTEIPCLHLKSFLPAGCLLFGVQLIKSMSEYHSTNFYVIVVSLKGGDAF